MTYGYGNGERIGQVRDKRTLVMDGAANGHSAGAAKKELSERFDTGMLGNIFLVCYIVFTAKRSAILFFASLERQC
jgi:folylpolyglutamate synthase/dihydropteroate synthase